MKSIDKRIIFLDFDGVLFNTVKEAYAIATIALGRYTTIDEINFDTSNYEKFHQYRYLVGPAWNYKYILHLIEQNGEDLEVDFNKMLLNIKSNDYLEFEKRFFETREKLKKTDFQKWLRLNEPYEFLFMIKDILTSQNQNYVIVTTKDKKTVQDLLKIEGIVIKDSEIYDKDDFFKFGNKATIISSIIEKHRITKSIFIDDSKKHLEVCTSIKHLQLFQASWGYISNNYEKDSLDMNQMNEIIQKFIGLRCLA